MGMITSLMGGAGGLKEKGTALLTQAAKIGAHSIDRKKKRSQLLGVHKRTLLSRQASEAKKAVASKSSGI